MASRAAPITRLIGRDDDLEAVLDLLTRDRLVSLTGPGGSGKTRLAEAAVRASLNVGRAAWFVDCSGIDDPDRIVPAIVAAMQLGGGGGDAPLQLVAARVADREALLVLDNLEQIDGAGQAAAALLGAIPSLRILATSRRPLGIEGELEFPVGPLALPDQPTVDAVEASAAGMLFITRTQARNRGWAPDATSAPDVAALLARLDGLPLAIELAAARMRTMSAREINQRLDDLGPAGIDTGEQDVKRSLRAILEWTARQLTPDEREVLDGASSCVTFDLALLQAMAPGRDVLPALESLVALGLVQRQPEVAGTSRHRVLVTIQEQSERQVPADRKLALRRRHAEHFAALAAAWSRRADAGDGPGLVVETDPDADNIRRALAYFETNDVEAAAALLVNLSFFFNARGRWREGYDAFVRLRTRTATPSIPLVRGALIVADLVWFALPEQGVLDLLDWAVAEAPRLGDQVLVEDALYYRAIRAANNEDVVRIAELRAQFDALPPATDPGAAGRRVNFEICAEEGAGNWEGPRVEGLVRQAIEHLGGIDDDRSLWRVVDLAIVLYRQRRYEEAEHYGAIAVTRYLDLGAEVYAAWGMTWLAQIHVQRGDMGKARDLLLILASIARRVRSTQNESSVFWVAMPLALDAGLPLLAARAYGALTHGTYATTSRLHSTVRITAEEWLARAARGRSSVEIELAVREGAEEDPVRLVEVIEEQLRSRRAPGARATTPALRHGELTPREVEVLSLVGAGRSDGDIAAELFISPKTASVHVSNVKAKLGVDSRLEMALRARDMGLVRA